MNQEEPSPLAAVTRLMAEAGVRYALIGGHAVNAWLVPRFTADIDLTIAANGAELERLRHTLASAGYRKMSELGGDQSSQPDFVAWVGPHGDPLEVQIAKTRLQDEVIRRAVVADNGLRVATKEDLIVLKLIADRTKDQIDLIGLCALDHIDWPYVEAWAREWEVSDRLVRCRAAVSGR